MKPEEKKVGAILVTGFGGHTALRLVQQLLSDRESATVYLLAPNEKQVEAQSFIQSLKPEFRVRCQVLEGSVTHMNLGLSSDLYRRLSRELTEIHHLAELTHRRSSGQYMRKVNVEGTREVLELAGESSSLKRFGHWSTVQVSGNRKGVVMEDELECDQRFVSEYQQTKYEAEHLVKRWARRLPVSVFRPGIVTGDSRSGAMDPTEPSFRLLQFIMGSPLTGGLPLPGSGDAPLHLVPVDYVVKAACKLAEMDECKGMTFHLVDPAPMSARRVCELIARKAHRRPPRAAIPASVARFLLRVPAVARWADSLPSAVVDLFDSMAFYNCRNTLSMLSDTGLRCPPLDAYVEQLVRFVRETQDTRRKRESEEISDPLA